MSVCASGGRDYARENVFASASGAALCVDGGNRQVEAHKDGSIRIEQTVFVARDGQKAIVLAKAASR